MKLILIYFILVFNLVNSFPHNRRKHVITVYNCGPIEEYEEEITPAPTIKTPITTESVVTTTEFQNSTDIIGVTETIIPENATERGKTILENFI